MSRFSVTISGDTLDELYSSAAEFVSRGNATPSTISVAVSDTGGLTAAVAPAAPTAPAPAETGDDDAGQTSAAEFDSAGIPWDERIHAGTRGVNQDGTWKRRRNTSDVLYASVMAELSQRTAGQAPTAPPASPAPAAPGIMDNGPVVIPAAPAPVAPPPTMVAPANVPAVPAAPVAAAPATPPTAPAPVVPSAEPVTEPAPAPVVAGMPFPVLMPKIAQAMKDGKFDNNALKGYLAQWNLTEIGQLATNPGLAQQFYDWLKSGNLID